MHGHATPKVSAPDLQDRAVLANPYLAYAHLRATAPVCRTERGYWLVTGYDEVEQVLRDTVRFSGRIPRDLDPELDAILATGYPEVPTLLAADPPDHSRYRGMVKKAFLPARVRQIEQQIAAIADELIDRFPVAGRVDFVAAFAVGLPLTVIADALGVDRSDLPLFKVWSDQIVAPRSGLLSRAEQLDAARALVEMQHYMAARCAERRAAPRDDLLSDLVQARFDDGPRAGEPLTLNELIGMIRQVLVAGNETTTSLIANMMRRFVDDSALQDEVRAQPSRLDNVIDETLRADAPIQMLPRCAIADVTIGTETIPAGDHLYVVYASANHDERRFADPEVFDPSRSNARAHLAFGKGAHFCIGAALARSEARIAFERLLARTSDWHLDHSSVDPVRRGLSMQLRGLSALDIVLRRIE